MNLQLLYSLTRFNSKPKTNQGFSLIEVMIGILILFGFVAAAMQTLVASAAIKVKAQERSEATAWIQQDIELIRYRASQLPATTTLCSATSATTGYADALRDVIAGASTSTTSTTAISKTSALGNRPYTVNRTISFKNASPYVVMEVNYNVPSPSNAAQSLSQMYTEVIPDQAFQCS
jgi:prepilin-type N-terminal cleavage/methylation domain-containing protein